MTQFFNCNQSFEYMLAGDKVVAYPLYAINLLWAFDNGNKNRAADDGAVGAADGGNIRAAHLSEQSKHAV